MVRILPMASSLRPSLSCFRFSSNNPFRVSLSSTSGPLSYLHLGNAVPQLQLFRLRASRVVRRLDNGLSINAAGNAAQASTSAVEENALEWVKKDNRRMLHVVYRVGDLDRTIKFYTECLGMKLLRKRDVPEEKYTNAFLGYGPEDSHFVIELTYNYGVDSYDIGAGFGHFGIAVEDVAKTVELVKAKGGNVTREPGPVKGGKTVIAFIEDPDGYKFELLERGPTPEPLCQVMLRVGDLDRSIEFHKNAYGMELLRTRDNPQYKYTIAMLGYGPEDKSAVMELTYNYGVTEYDKGNAYAQIAIGTDDVYKTAEAIKLCGGKITKAMRLVTVRGLKRREHIRLSEFKNLPPDLWLEILARLPVKTLLRSRCVCKTWCSIIDSHDFIYMHVALYKNNLLRNCLLTFEVVPQPVSKLQLYSSDSFKKIGQLLENSGKFYFVGSCNGLLLQGYGSKFRLLNPSINKSRILPPCPIDSESGVNYVLGFAPSRNDYKVVGFTRNLEEVAIYSFRDHCWRFKSDVNIVLGSCFLESLDINSVVFLEKAAYWFEGDTHKFGHGKPLFSYLASFDFDAEEFSVFGLPDDDGETLAAQFIFTLCNEIAVLSMNSESTYVRILEKNATKEPWRLCFSAVTNSDALKLIEGATDLPSVILYVQRSNTILIALDGKLMYYNLCNHQVQLLRESAQGRLIAVTYIENLIFHKC